MISLRKAFILIVVIVLLISGCAGPSVREPVTAGEYRIDGKTYKVMGTSTGFEQRGLASWYGGKFHGRQTASGEVYDKNKLTAAHRTLPLGTYVRVRRVDGRGEVVLRVNDRGPFVEGRILDVSRAGAEKLHMLEEGVAMVTVKALGSRDRRSSPEEMILKSRPDYHQGSFAVQIGAFAVRENARDLAVRMRERYGAAHMSLFNRGDRTFYRVRVGRFKLQEQAENFRLKLINDGWAESFVVSR